MDNSEFSKLEELQSSHMFGNASNFFSSTNSKHEETSRTPRVSQDVRVMERAGILTITPWGNWRNHMKEFTSATFPSTSELAETAKKVLEQNVASKRATLAMAASSVEITSSSDTSTDSSVILIDFSEPSSSDNQISDEQHGGFNVSNDVLGLSNQAMDGRSPAEDNIGEMSAGNQISEMFAWNHINEMPAENHNSEMPAGNKNSEMPAGNKNSEMPAGNKNSELPAENKNSEKRAEDQNDDNDNEKPAEEPIASNTVEDTSGLGCQPHQQPPALTVPCPYNTGCFPYTPYVNRNGNRPRNIGFPRNATLSSRNRNQLCSSNWKRRCQPQSICNRATNAISMYHPHYNFFTNARRPRHFCRPRFHGPLQAMANHQDSFGTIFSDHLQYNEIVRACSQRINDASRRNCSRCIRPLMRCVTDFVLIWGIALFVIISWSFATRERTQRE